MAALKLAIFLDFLRGNLVFHGQEAVAALKLAFHEHAAEFHGVFHGQEAVAALKLRDRAAESPGDPRSSTAKRPWPH